MTISKAPKSQNPHETDLIKSDVASFASSIGLSSSSLPKSGFDDSDFRKSGPLKPTKTPKPLPLKTPPPSRNPKSQKRTQNPSHHSKPNPLFDSSKSPQTRTNGQDLPKLPLMKASALSGQWHVDAAELEWKVLGEGGGWNIGDRNVKEMMRLAPEKKGLAQRLLEQYANDYESSRGTSGDIRLVVATQRSGTAKDKVAAFTCMVDDNPIANIRSLDALLGTLQLYNFLRHNYCVGIFLCSPESQLDALSWTPAPAPLSWQRSISVSPARPSALSSDGSPRAPPRPVLYLGTLISVVTSPISTP